MWLETKFIGDETRAEAEPLLPCMTCRKSLPLAQFRTRTTAVPDYFVRSVASLYEPSCMPCLRSQRQRRGHGRMNTPGKASGKHKLGWQALANQLDADQLYESRIRQELGLTAEEKLPIAGPSPATPAAASTAAGASAVSVNVGNVTITACGICQARCEPVELQTVALDRSGRLQQQVCAGHMLDADACPCATWTTRWPVCKGVASHAVSHAAVHTRCIPSTASDEDALKTAHPLAYLHRMLHRGSRLWRDRAELVAQVLKKWQLVLLADDMRRLVTEIIELDRRESAHRWQYMQPSNKEEADVDMDAVANTDTKSATGCGALKRAPSVTLPSVALAHSSLAHPTARRNKKKAAHDSDRSGSVASHPTRKTTTTTGDELVGDEIVGVPIHDAAWADHCYRADLERPEFDDDDAVQLLAESRQRDADNYARLMFLKLLPEHVRRAHDRSKSRFAILSERLTTEHVDDQICNVQQFRCSLCHEFLFKDSSRASSSDHSDPSSSSSSSSSSTSLSSNDTAPNPFRKRGLQWDISINRIDASDKQRPYCSGVGRADRNFNVVHWSCNREESVHDSIRWIERLVRIWAADVDRLRSALSSEPEARQWFLAEQAVARQQLQTQLAVMRMNASQRQEREAKLQQSRQKQADAKEARATRDRQSKHKDETEQLARSFLLQVELGLGDGPVDPGDVGRVDQGDGQTANKSKQHQDAKHDAKRGKETPSRQEDDDDAEEDPEKDHLGDKEQRRNWQRLSAALPCTRSSGQHPFSFA